MVRSKEIMKKIILTLLKINEKNKGRIRIIKGKGLVEWRGENRGGREGKRRKGHR